MDTAGGSECVISEQNSRVWNRMFCARPVDSLDPPMHAYIHNVRMCDMYAMYMISLGATETIQDIALLLTVQLLQ